MVAVPTFTSVSDKIPFLCLDYNLPKNQNLNLIFPQFTLISMFFPFDLLAFRPEKQIRFFIHSHQSIV